MPTEIYSGRQFDAFCGRHGIVDADLVGAVREMDAGLIHASLGSGLFKQRLAVGDGGKSGGYRTVLAFRSGRRAVFVFGFAKNAKADLSPKESVAFRKLAKSILAMTVGEMNGLVERGAFRRVGNTAGPSGP